MYRTAVITLQAYKIRYFWAGRVRLQMRRLFRLSRSCLLGRAARNKGKGHNPIRDISTAKKKSFLKVEKGPIVYLKKKSLTYCLRGYFARDGLTLTSELTELIQSLIHLEGGVHFSHLSCGSHACMYDSTAYSCRVVNKFLLMRHYSWEVEKCKGLVFEALENHALAFKNSD